MSVTQVFAPSRILFGGGAARQTTQILKSMRLKRPFLMTDTNLASAGVLQNITTTNNDDSHDFKFSIWDQCIPDPTSNSIMEALDAFNRNDHDCIIAVGGGSAIDAAKALGIIAKHGGQAKDYKVPRDVLETGFPVIALPSTAGTGSEVTKFTVITDSESNEKMLCSGSGFVPSVAIVDYELSLSCPFTVTGGTGMDALTHALEALVSVKRNPYSNRLALSALSDIPSCLQSICIDSQNMEAREKLSMAATFAGMAFSASSVGLIHAMSRPLGAVFHIPHGLANAMLLPKVTQWSMESDAKHLYAEASLTMGACNGNEKNNTADERCKRLISYLRELNDILQIETISQCIVDENEYVKAIPLMADQAIASGSHLNNPRVPNKDELENLFMDVYLDMKT
mmetsp:Transcript_28401/g.35129  ORF Transcript_28401/g.35129 Transcript_28401/m.35129 type:complete len:398 (-) Transcript_28401:148-1341(-)